ncbi:MAG: GGDEF domain-containing protein [Sulfobacillus thermotolerans]|nr:GGDEF domain-containing protein [Sulfobacillus thermotolerans]
MPNHSNTDSYYDQALKLMAQGASIDDMITTLNTSRGEIYHTVRVIFTDMLRRYGAIAAATSSVPEIAEWDALTGALTRRTGEIALLQMLQKTQEDQPFSIIFIDLDNLKQMNDAYGHQAGDHLLCQLVHVVLSNIRRSDQLIRWAGDEFILVLPHTPKAIACETLKRLRRADPTLQFSAGVAQWEPGDSLSSLIDRADRAMYQDKRQRKTQTSSSSKQIRHFVREHRAIKPPLKVRSLSDS